MQIEIAVAPIERNRTDTNLLAALGVGFRFVSVGGKVKVAEFDFSVCADSLMDAVNLAHDFIVLASDAVIYIGLTVQVLPPSATEILCDSFSQARRLFLCDKLGGLDAIGNQSNFVCVKQRII